MTSDFGPVWQPATPGQSACGCAARNAGLGTTEAWWVLWRGVNGTEYEQTVLKVNHRVESDFYPWYCGPWGKNCLAYDTTDLILRVYINLARKGSIPDYHPRLNELAKDSTAHSRLVSTVAQSAGMPGQRGYQLVWQHLISLWRLTAEGKLPHTRYAAPANAERNKDTQGLPEGQGFDDDPGMGTVLGLAVAAGLVAVGTYAYSHFVQPWLNRGGAHG